MCLPRHVISFLFRHSYTRYIHYHHHFSIYIHANTQNDLYICIYLISYIFTAYNRMRQMPTLSALAVFSSFQIIPILCMLCSTLFLSLPLPLHSTYGVCVCIRGRYVWIVKMCLYAKSVSAIRLHLDSLYWHNGIKIRSEKERRIHTS